MDSSYNDITNIRFIRCFKTILRLIETGGTDSVDAEIIEICNYAISNKDPYGSEIPYDTKPKQVKTKDNKLITTNKLLSLITRR